MVVRVPMKTAVWGTSRELGIYLFTKKPPPSNSGSANYGERGQAYRPDTLLRIPLPENSSFWTTQGDLNGKPSSNLEALEKQTFKLRVTGIFSRVSHVPDIHCYIC